MATQEPAEKPQQAMKSKTWVLKTSIHCEGCKRKVKKILNQVHGVENVEVDIKQQKVIVTGNVDGDSLIKKLMKSGKNAELRSEKTEKNEKYSGQGKSKETVQTERQSNVQRNHKNDAKKEHKPAVDVEDDKDPAKVSDGGASTSGPATKNGKESGGAAEIDGGEVKSNEKSDAGGCASVKVSEGMVKPSSSDQVADSKSEEKKPGSFSAGAAPPVAEEKVDTESKSGEPAEKSNGGGGGVERGTSGKKKKKQGQNGNRTECAKSSGGPPARTGLEDHREAGPPPVPVPPNHIPPRQHGYHDHPPPPHQYFATPPVYAMSYNTSYPAGHTASYYAAPPLYSYAYTYSGRDLRNRATTYFRSKFTHATTVGFVRNV